MSETRIRQWIGPQVRSEVAHIPAADPGTGASACGAPVSNTMQLELLGSAPAPGAVRHALVPNPGASDPPDGAALRTAHAGREGAAGSARGGRGPLFNCMANRRSSRGARRWRDVALASFFIPTHGEGGLPLPASRLCRSDSIPALAHCGTVSFLVRK